MTAALIALAAGVWLGFCAAVVLAIYLSARHEREWDAEADEAIALTLPANLAPLSDSEVAGRIQAQMDENAALRELRAGLEAWGKP